MDECTCLISQYPHRVHAAYCHKAGQSFTPDMLVHRDHRPQFESIVGQLRTDVGPMRVAVAALVIGGLGFVAGMVAIVVTLTGGWPR